MSRPPFGWANETRRYVMGLRKDEPNADALFKTVLLQETKGLMAYAQTYAKAGIGMRGEALQVQILYVLCNLGGWRGEVARKVKVALKKVESSLRA